ncbi:MAG: bacteriophage Gp15 family protein [Oscillospiraceae bacterium]|nr:bacteriophage Gp15 family protein [Oscillospiraceae bacterium]
MSSFSLYKKKGKAFPESLFADGKLYKINPDFRNILRIFALAEDKNIPDAKKATKISEWFFDGEIPTPALRAPPSGKGASGYPELTKAADIFSDFIAGDSAIPPPLRGIPPLTRGANEDSAQFCFDFDAGEIYADFLSVYNIDLVEVDFLHWYKFKILLENLPPDGAFRRKIELRFLDLSNMTGDNLSKLTDAKERVQLPEKFFDRDLKYSDNLQDLEEFNNIWGKAGNN